MEGFTKFVDHISKHAHSTSLIYQSFLMLFTSLLHISEEIAKRLSPIHAFESITSCHTISEVEGWYRLRLFPVLFDVIESELERSGKQLVEKVRQYIEVHYSEDLSLTVMADHVGLNPSYFSRLFTQSSGVNYVHYVAQVKIDQAKILLAESDLTISAIAEQIGYTEPTFRRVFKQHMGMTPHEYRSLQRA